MLYLVVLLLLAWPLGLYMARVYQGERVWLACWLRPLENGFYRLAGVNPEAEMGWRAYAAALLVFNGLGLLVVFLLQRLQGWLPLNPQGFTAVPAPLAFNTAVSFASNTNWQFYGGETTICCWTRRALTPWATGRR